MSQIKPAEVSAILREQLAGNQTDADLQEVGTVLQVGDGIARIYGLSNVQAGELIEFENGVRGIALNLEETMSVRYCSNLPGNSRRALR